MNYTRTKVDKTPVLKLAKVKKLSAAELDELCRTCGHMRRSHIQLTKIPCGVDPCLCLDFVASGIYHDWSGGATVTILETEAIMKAQYAEKGLDWPPKWLSKTSTKFREKIKPPVLDGCQQCGGKLKKKGDILCPNCGKSYSASLDFDPNR